MLYRVSSWAGKKTLTRDLIHCFTLTWPSRLTGRQLSRTSTDIFDRAWLSARSLFLALIVKQSCVVDWAQSTNWLTKIPLVILINRKGDLHSTWRDISTRMIALSGKQSGWRFVNYAVIITNPVGGNHIQQDLLQMVIHSHFDIWFLSNTYSQAFYSQCRKHTHTHMHKYSTDPCLKKRKR